MLPVKISESLIEVEVARCSKHNSSKPQSFKWANCPFAFFLWPELPLLTEKEEHPVELDLAVSSENIYEMCELCGQCFDPKSLPEDGIKMDVLISGEGTSTENYHPALVECDTSEDEDCDDDNDRNKSEEGICFPTDKSTYEIQQSICHHYGDVLGTGECGNYEINCPLEESSSENICFQDEAVKDSQETFTSDQEINCSTDESTYEIEKRICNQNGSLEYIEDYKEFNTVENALNNMKGPNYLNTQTKIKGNQRNNRTNLSENLSYDSDEDESYQKGCCLIKMKKLSPRNKL
ncbi:hypothetical protein J6590_007957 [Homalodisca vitripennis]|uniref:Uncharacterized protein n=1 Tax=Homalodisca liturata TaxID=320908 RepID=A0A1B6HD02_9HEMI|nr:hypothetical protein J6590_007957 [Homalodisca vitripennis]